MTVEREKDQINAKTAWNTLLHNISNLARLRQKNKKAFISYAWPPEGEERDTLQAWLKQLQDNLELAGITTFLDIRDMQGNLDVTMRNNLEASDFVIPILTPRFLARAEDPKTNLSFEFNLTLEKTKANPAAMLPILHTGQFQEVVKGPLAVLPKHLIYTIRAETRIEPYLVNLSPLGLIPIIYGIRIGDQDYENLLTTWRHSHLTRLPPSLPHAIERRGLMAETFYQPGGKEPVSVQIIQGIGGVGKTQLANMYAHRITANYQGFVRWLSADSLHLRVEWLHLGELLGLELTGLSESDQRQKIRAALKAHEKWLIILDGLENEAALQGLLPEILSPTQQVLITTRSQHWRYPILVVPPFTPEEAQTYFTSNHLTPHQEKGKNKLAEILGYLPLALKHAVSYMKSANVNAKSYLTLYQKQGILLFSDDGVFLNSYQHAIEQLAIKNPSAAELVKFCAYFPDGKIDERHIKVLVNLEDSAFDTCIVNIRDYGLLMRSETGLTMHPLVQAAIRQYEKTTCVAGEIVTRRLQSIGKLIGQVPLVTATTQALQSSSAFFQSAATVIATPQSDLSDQKIKELKAQLAELEKNREACLAKTAYKELPALTNTEEITARIKTLKEEREKCEEADDDFPDDKSSHLKLCIRFSKELPETDKKIHTIREEIQNLKEEQQANISIPFTKEGQNKTPMLKNEAIIKGKVGKLNSGLAIAKNVPVLLAEKVMTHQEKLLAGGALNTTILEQTGEIEELFVGIGNIDFAP